MYYIYKIENLVNHKKYIGLTNNILRRKNRHFTDLRRNMHDNSFLQKEFNIYGESNFSFSIEFQGDVTSKEISEKEKEFIKKYDSYKNGYNQNEGGNFGPANGGSHLTESDILNILAVLEFMTKPGQLLGNIFDVSRTTISRIKHGINHNQYKEEYEKLSYEERKQIYNNFCKDMNLLEEKANLSKLNAKRQLTKEQVYLILINEELNRPITIDNITIQLGLLSSNTVYCILRGQTYQDYMISYNKLTQSQKDELASLLRNQYCKTP